MGALWLRVVFQKAVVGGCLWWRVRLGSGCPWTSIRLPLITCGHGQVSLGNEGEGGTMDYPGLITSALPSAGLFVGKYGEADGVY